MLYGDADANRLTEQVLEACVEVPRNLGPGLSESVYEECLVMELSDRELTFERQVPLPVERSVVVELKAIERLAPIHQCQLITYLKLTGVSIGLLVNFHVPLLREGVKRVVRPDLLPQNLRS